MFDHFLTSLTDPAELFGHFTYLLLVVSMMMRRMEWLRGLAVASGVAKLFYRAVLVPDPVSVFWELIFIAVNIGQLLLIWYYERHHRFSDDEKFFMSTMPPGVERHAIRRLLRMAEVTTLEGGKTLTREGEAVDQLLYLTAGVATVEKGGSVVAACGAGDYIGEMSFLTGSAASATVRAVKPMRCLAFNQAKLRAAISADTGIRRAMEASLNRNLVFKLTRNGDHVIESPADQPSTGSGS